MVVKPSEHAPVSVLQFASLFERAGFPDGVFNTIGGGRPQGEWLVSHPDVDHITFTGAVRASSSKTIRCHISILLPGILSS